MKSSQFSVASLYFDRAISALGDRQWSSTLYDISLDLYISEAYHGTDDFDNMDTTLEVIFRNATSFEDKLQAYSTQVHANGARNRLQKALRISLSVLKELEVILPKNPRMITVIRQYRKTRQMLNRKSDRALLNLPNATDVSKIAAMEMLSVAMVFSYLSKPEVGAVTVFQLIQLILEYGVTASAGTAFSAYGFMLLAHIGNIKVGVRHGKIALLLLGN